MATMTGFTNFGIGTSITMAGFPWENEEMRCLVASNICVFDGKVVLLVSLFLASVVVLLR